MKHTTVQCALPEKTYQPICLPTVTTHPSILSRPQTQIGEAAQPQGSLSIITVHVVRAARPRAAPTNCGPWWLFCGVCLCYK